MKTSTRSNALAVALICIALFGTAPATAAPSKDRPNIIFLIGDDHGYPYFGFMGDPTVQTPNLDKLAAGGTVFPRAHSTSNVCAPALGSLLTGLYPLQWEKKLKQLYQRPGNLVRRENAIREFATLPRVLGEHGYVSFQTGKFWEESASAAGFTAGTVSDPNRKQRFGDDTFGRTTIAPALEFIDENAARPFFLWFAPMLPHMPFNAPKRYVDLYEGETGLSKAAREYYANCSWFDDLVGQLVDHLEARGLRKRTLLVYISDNGWDIVPVSKTTGAKGKASMHEQAFRTPMIFNQKGVVPAGVVDDRPVSLVDLFPTALDYAGIDTIPPGRKGIDLRPVIEGKGGPRRDVLIGQVNRPMKRRGPKSERFYLRSARWHYIWHRTDGREELYDKSVDPDETMDVAATHPDVTKGFRRRIEDWEREVTSAILG